jgi:hypothetical protein
MPSKRARSTDPNHALRNHVRELLGGGHAHIVFEDVVAEWPREFRGAKPPGQPFTAWRLLEHLRIAQWDIVEFTTNAKHVSPEWPAGYWPPQDAPPTDAAWDESVAQVRRDHRTMERIVADLETDLFAHIPHGKGQTVLREALLVADHNAYHLGQLVLLKRLLGLYRE